MAESTKSEKRRLDEYDEEKEEKAPGDDDDDEWIGPLPAEAAKPKKRKGMKQEIRRSSSKSGNKVYKCRPITMSPDYMH
jgi:hypothetical protein